jgi:hypothetical protein
VALFGGGGAASKRQGFFRFASLRVRMTAGLVETRGKPESEKSGRDARDWCILGVVFGTGRMRDALADRM